MEAAKKVRMHPARVRGPTPVSRNAKCLFCCEMESMQVQLHEHTWRNAVEGVSQTLRSFDEKQVAFERA